MDLCITTLRLERGPGADDDLFARSVASEPALKKATAPGRGVAARRGAAFLARSLVEGCGHEMLRGGGTATSALQKLWRFFKEINEGPGVARAQKKADTKSRSLHKSQAAGEWSLETDPVVRFHVEIGLGAINQLMLQELRLDDIPHQISVLPGLCS